MASPRTLSYSASLVSQGTHRFYTLTMPSEVLRRTCFVTNRLEDPIEGFQRLLNRERAQDIADYIDEGLGTIPTSIILSAQESAEFNYDSARKTISFRDLPKAFLVLDGQHRVYGFALAKSNLRVPVVIYTDLTRRNETRIFIDINTKQRPVPSELLLDIKSLADYESDNESFNRKLFDILRNDQSGPLYGRLSAASRSRGKLSRVTFNSAVSPIAGTFQGSAEDAADALSSYLAAVSSCLDEMKVSDALTKPIPFRGLLRVFPSVARRVKDRHGSDYSVDNFLEILRPALSNVGASRFRKPGKSVAQLADTLQGSLDADFVI